MKILKFICCIGQNDLDLDLENMTLTFTFLSHIRFWLSVSENLFFNRKIIKFCSLIVKILKFIACIGQSDLDLDLDHMTITFFIESHHILTKMPPENFIFFLNFQKKIFVIFWDFKFFIFFLYLRFLIKMTLTLILKISPVSPVARGN